MLQQTASEPESARRVVRRVNDWTLKEHEVVVSFWPDLEEIRRRLPHRSEQAIKSFAGKCNLRRHIHVWSEGEDAALRKRVREGISRKQIAREMGMTLNQVANRMAYITLRYESRAPKPSGHRLMDAILQRAFDLNMSRRELDDACGSGGAFSRWSPARQISTKHLVAAVRYMEGTLTAEWSPL